METKRCSICMHEQPIEDYNYANAVNGIRPDGVPNSYCAFCLKKYNQVKKICGTGDNGTKKWIKLQQESARMEGRT